MGFWKSKKVAAGGSGGDTKVAEKAKNGENGASKEGEAGDTKKKKPGCCDRLTKKFGWLCCGLCNGFKPNRAPGTQFLDKAERKVNDCFCCGAFLSFVLLWFIVCGFAVHTGEPLRLVYGTDYTGHVCAAAPNEGKKWLYYPRLNEDLFASLSEIGTNWEDLQDAVLTGGMDVLSKIKLTGVCVTKCPNEGDLVCSRDYLAEKGVGNPYQLAVANDIYKCRASMSFSLLNSELCGSCWVTPLNTTDIFYRCLEVVISTKFDTDLCVNPRLDEETGAEILASDPRCMTKETTYVEVERKAAYPNPVAEFLGEAVESIGSYIADMQKTRSVIFFNGVGLALVAGFAWLAFLRKFVRVIVWGTIVSYLGMVLFCACWLWYKAGFFAGYDEYYREFFAVNGTNTDSFGINVTSIGSSISDMIPLDAKIDISNTFNVSPDASSRELYKVAAMVLSILELVSVVLVFVWKQKIRIMIAVIKEATIAIMKMPFLTILPWFTTLQVMLLTLYSIGMMTVIQTIDMEHPLFQWAAESANGAVGLACSNVTMSVTEFVNGEEVEVLLQVPSCNSTAYEVADESFVDGLLWFHVFMYLWVNQLILAISCCTIAGAVCQWYFTRPRVSKHKDLGGWPILESYYRTMRYHLGSLAMGSFFVAVVQILRMILEYVNKRTKSIQDKNRVVHYLMLALRCVMWCFEKSMKYMTQNAYILIAMKGLSFCAAAKESFHIIFHNMVQLAMIAMMTKVVVFLGKVFIVLLCSFCTYSWISYVPQYQIGGEEELGSFIFPTVLVGVISYFVAQSFLQVFALTITTIMICFIEDREANKRNPSESYYPENLYKVIVPESEREDVELDCTISDRPKGNPCLYPENMGPLTEEEADFI